MNTWSDLSAPVQTLWIGAALAAASYGIGHTLFRLVMWSIAQ